jgi:hypothetical protein
MNQSYYVTTANELMKKRISVEYPLTVTTHPLPDLVRAQPNTQYKTFTSYSGADLVVFIDGEAVGELEAIHYHKVSPKFAIL